MSRVRVVEKEIEEEGKLFLVLNLGLKNASLVLFSEGDNRLGTLAVAIPQAQEMVGLPLSSLLLGDRNVVLARSLAEQLAQKTKKIALVSVFTRTLSESEAGPIFMRLAKKIVENEEEYRKK